MPLTTPSSLLKALTQPVAIFGAGLSGQGAEALLLMLGVPSVIYDQKGLEFTTMGATQHQLVVFSPGFPADHPWLVDACASGLECMGELDFAALFWRGRVIAITGTNGKTTLTEFITHALLHVCEPAHAMGNIGRPFTRLVADTAGGSEADIAICEVSSFQAETIQRFRAEAVLWTNFGEDHLDRHPNMESYFNAKWCLVTRTAENKVFAGTSVNRFAKKTNYQLPVAAWIDTEDQPADPQLSQTVFAAYPQRENFLLAAAWWRHTGRDLGKLYEAAQTFRLGRHRMTRVTEIEGVTYWNDSKATNFHAVESALLGFDAPVHLIVGGKSKGGDVAAFVGRIAPRVARLILIGQTRPILASACDMHRVEYGVCDTLESAVQEAGFAAKPGEHVLLSPGFASFDMFRSYEDRGNQYEILVRKIVSIAKPA
jgi:UDP-N-acetylmuramoylalanine--D-glutamate ligase|uniref:UDP-N-acetylmuramoyl-L-alanine--D-glutamate ligase n=1 Tax=Cephaloticoccus sp. TaxID=1985742 RepID=UPI00404A1760